MPYPKSKKINCQRWPYLQSFNIFFCLDHCVCPKLPEISAAKVQCVQRLIFFILNSTHSHNLPYQKGKKIGCLRRPYLQVLSKKSSDDHCACSKMPEISAAKVQRVRRLFFVILNSTHQYNLPCKKGKNIGCRRQPYLQVFRKNPVLIILRDLSCLRSQQKKCNLAKDYFLSF